MTILATQSRSVAAESESWHHQMKLAIRDTKKLAELLSLPDGVVSGAKASQQFPVFVPLPYLERIRMGDPEDPLLRQVLPVPDEDAPANGYTTDPLQESQFAVHPGLLQKYPGRILLVTTGACAVNCRYCFRRHYPYQNIPNTPERWRAVIEQIAEDTSIDEVILSGGDPLTMNDDYLAQLIDLLNDNPYLDKLRIHTRLPIVIPQRITPRLLQILSESRLRPIMVVHCNHAREIDMRVERAFERLTRAGVKLLNQSVLLHRVNDDAETLIELSRRLVDCGVIPYYLHQLDPVAGAAHFDVPIKHGLELMAQMQSQLPGYAVPRYVQEIPGKSSKTVLA